MRKLKLELSTVEESLRRRNRRLLFAKLKSPSDDHFKDKMIGASGHSNAHTKVEFPLRRNVEVDGWKNLMLLFPLRIEAAEWAKRAVIFKSGIDFFGYRVSDFEVRGELEAFLFPWAGQCALERGIE